MQRRHFITTLSLGGAAALTGCQRRTVGKNGQPVLRFGHFPNITHVQALVAHQLSRQGKGWFEERLGVEIQWYVYNAGPSATEAIFARSLDVTYIGPSPTLNAYARSKSEDIRILAGAANGGVALLTHPKAGITTVEDFRGKTVATPQLGNTQDIDARAYFLEHGFTVTQTGGDVIILPTSNADQLPLFQRGDLNAVWAVEPWASRLELEAGAKVFLEDKETNITLLVSSAAFLNEQPELARQLVVAHRELTEWIIAHPAEARALLVAELTEQLKVAPSDAIIDRALARVELTNEISRPSLEKMAAKAQSIGYLKDLPPLDKLLPTLTE